MLLSNRTNADTTLSPGTPFNPVKKRHSNLPHTSSLSLAHHSSCPGKQHGKRRRICRKAQFDSSCQIMPLAAYGGNSSTEAVLEAITSVNLQLQGQVTTIARRLDEIGNHLDMIRKSLDVLEGRLVAEQTGGLMRTIDT